MDEPTPNISKLGGTENEFATEMGKIFRLPPAKALPWLERAERWLEEERAFCLQSYLRQSEGELFPPARPTERLSLLSARRDRVRQAISDAVSVIRLDEENERCFNEILALFEDGKPRRSILARLRKEVVRGRDALPVFIQFYWCAANNGPPYVPREYAREFARYALILSGEEKMSTLTGKLIEGEPLSGWLIDKNFVRRARKLMAPKAPHLWNALPIDRLRCGSFRAKAFPTKL